MYVYILHSTSGQADKFQLIVEGTVVCESPAVPNILCALFCSFYVQYDTREKYQ